MIQARIQGVRLLYVVLFTDTVNVKTWRNFLLRKKLLIQNQQRSTIYYLSYITLSNLRLNARIMLRA